MINIVLQKQSDLNILIYAFSGKTLLSSFRVSLPNKTPIFSCTEYITKDFPSSRFYVFYAKSPLGMLIINMTVQKSNSSIGSWSEYRKLGNSIKYEGTDIF